MNIAQFFFNMKHPFLKKIKILILYFISLYRISF